MEWISVNDRMPDLVEDYGVQKESKEIFISNGSDVFVGWFNNIHGWCTWGMNGLKSITHWMEWYEVKKIPEPPKQNYMQTPLAELIEWMDSYGSSYEVILKAKAKATELLEKEKEVIMDAYWNGRMEIYIDSFDYFTKTFTDESK